MKNNRWAYILLVGFLAFVLLALGFDALRAPRAVAAPVLGFDPAVNYAAGNRPYTLASGDLDNDGDLDLITANYYSDDLGVLLGAGDGTFAAPITYSVGTFPHTVIAADFNADGSLDLAVSENSTTYVSVLIGLGNGSFNTSSGYSLSGTGFSMVTADLDNDGNLDLAVTITGNLVEVMSGAGDGTFASSGTYGVGTGPEGLATGDFDGDGDIDLATANTTANSLSVLLNNGNGTFASAVGYAVGSVPKGIVAADLNRDGQLDLAVTNQISNNVSVRLGNGDGSFASATTYAAGSAPAFLRAADLDRDGDLDLVVAASTANSVSVLLGDGSGAFAAPVALSVGAQPTDVEVADLDGDGDLDIASANHNDTTDDVSVLLNITTLDPAGTFEPAVDYSMSYNPAGLIVADLNRDGSLDMVTANSGAGYYISRRLGNGDGTFAGEVTFSSGGSSPVALTAGDLDRDGNLDLAIANSGSGSVGVLLGNGSGSFAAPVTYTVDSGPNAVIAADLDSDGDLDLATANTISNTISVILGEGDGTFTTTVNYAAGTQPFTVITGDVNADGSLDLIVACVGSYEVGVLLGAGDGTFGAMTGHSVGNTTFYVTAADLDKDGDLDLAATLVTDEVSVLLGDGSGNFSAPSTFYTGMAPKMVIAADVNRDGLLDLLTANGSSDDVSVLMGMENNVFANAVSYATGSSPQQLAAADLDRDGDLDLAVANNGGHSVSVLLNAPIPEIEVYGSGSPIFDGSGSANVTDGTDFGGAAGGYDTVTHSFAISNTGDLTLTVSAISFTGPAAADFSTFGISLPTDIPAGGDITFDIIFSPLDGGDRHATANIANNDGDENPFDFALHGFGTNYAPQASGDTFSVVRYLPSLLDVLANDSDPDSTLTIMQVSAPLNGSASIDGATIVYTPTLGYLGADSLTYTISDGSLSDTAAVTLTVTATPSVELLPAANYSTATLGKYPHRIMGGNDPVSVIQSDLDGDGDLDLVTANFTDGDISVLLANSDGTYAQAVNYVTGAQASAVAAANLNRDGIPDLAVANRLDNNVSVLLGNGDGTFSLGGNYNVDSFYPSSVACADLDGDGDLDLVTANSGMGSDNVRVLLNNGSGVFTAAGAYAVGTAPVSVITGDFNRDGNLDLATANQNSANMSVLLGVGDGTFLSAVNYTTGNSPSSVASADIDGDGDLDIAVTNQSSNDVSVLLNNGSGGFGAANNYPVAAPNSVTFSDLDRDGDLDLITANIGSNNLSAWQNDGSGTFANVTYYNAGSTPIAVITGDLDGDGDPDLVAANSSSNDVSVLRNVTAVQPTGSFEPLVEYAVGLNPQPVVTSDLNGDGNLDLAVANRADHNVSVLLGNGDGTFAPQATYTVGPVGGSPESILAADLDGDGDLDLATANSNPGNVSVLLGYSDGTFAAAVPYTVGSGANFVVAGDLDRDGDLDLVTADLYDNRVSVLLGNGDGTFAGASNIPVSTYPLSVALGDLDRDGILDVFVTYSGVTNVSVLIGNGDGSFAPQADHAIPSGSPHVTSGDVNKDSRLDLVAVGGGNVIVMLGDGLGGFESTTTYPAEAGAYHTTIGDFNRDGNPDLVTANYSSQSLSVLFGNGNGSFAAAVSYPTGANSEATAAGDLDGDGDLDLVVTMPNPSNLGVLLNQNYLPEIELIGYGSGMPIEDGSTTPSMSNGTDFGSISTASGSLTNTFVISNTGAVDLNVSNILITGATPADFTLAGNPFPATIPPGSSISFYLIFDPSTVGVISATVEIANDDSDENPFDFVIQGTGENQGPDAVDDAFFVLEDTPAFLAVLSNDSDPDGDPIFITDVSTPLNGSASVVNIAGEDQVFYTPTLGYLGTDNFVYTISDGNLTDMALVTVTVFSTCQVTNLNDSGPGSLRQALLEANPGNTLCFASNLSGEILFASPITLTQDVTIISRAGILFTSGIARSPGQGTTRLLEVSPGVNVTLDGVTITNGYTPDMGGGILNYGTLTLSNCSFTNNIAGMGGAIYNLGTLTLSHTTLHGNTASVGGGIFNLGTLNMDSSVFSQNSPTNCYLASPAVSGGYNISSDTSCQLGGMNDRNGAGAQTMAAQLDGTAPLLEDSLGIGNVIAAGLCGGNDQAGTPRSTPCDSGALEFTGTPLARLGASLRTNNTRPSQGQIFDVILTVQDVGPAAAASLSLNLPLPAGLNYAGTATWTGGLGCTLGTPPSMLTCASLPAGTSLALSVPVQVTTANVGTQLTINATASAAVVAPANTSLLVITATPPQPPPAGRYVSVDGSDSGDCSTPASACRTIAYALGQAANGDTLFLANGTYNETGIAINKSVTILGLNGAANTILDGSHAGRIFELPLGVTVTLDGLTILNGVGTLGNFGGGIYNNGSLTVENCIFNGNAGPVSGGGIYNDGILEVINSTLAGNTALMFGGGIYNAGTLTVINSSLSGNFADLGAGINNNDGSLTVRNSVVAGNTSTRQGGIFSTNTWSVSNSVLQDVVAGTNNVVANPLFERIPFTNGSADYGDLRLMPGSPAIGRGSACPQADLVGTERLNDCSAGAYEFLYAVAAPLRQPGEVQAVNAVYTFVNESGTVTLNVPPRAVDQTVYLVFNHSPEDWGQVGTLKFANGGRTPQDWGQVGTMSFGNGGFRAYGLDYGPLPIDFTFLRPMTMTLEYNPDAFPGLELDLTPVRFNPLTDSWEILTQPVLIDQVNNTVSFPIMQAGEYRLLGMPPGLYANLSAVTPGGVVNLASGSLITYTLTALNSTDLPLYNLEMGLTLPDGLDFVGWIYANGASYLTGTITWEMNSLASMGLQWASFVVQVSSDAQYYGQTITTTATLNLPGKGAVDSAAIISVNGPNVPVADQVSTEENTSFSLRPAANDFNPDLSPLLITDVGSPAHGEVRLVDDTLTYTPTLGYHGFDSFSYTVQDGQFIATSTITVRVASLAYLNVAKIMESEGDISSYLTDLPKGHVLTYTISLYNAPDGEIAENVVLTDVLPAGIQFVEWIEQSGAVLEEGVLTWSAAQVPLDATVTIRFRAIITGPFSGVVENSVRATASNADPAQATAVFTVFQPRLVFLPTVQR